LSARAENESEIAGSSFDFTAEVMLDLSLSIGDCLVSVTPTFTQFFLLIPDNQMDIEKKKKR